MRHSLKRFRTIVLLFTVSVELALIGCAQFGGKISSEGDPSIRHPNGSTMVEAADMRAAFRRGAQVLFQNPAHFHDPHCLMTLGLLRKPLVAAFGRKQVDIWVAQAVAGICLVHTGKKWFTAEVRLPYLPDPPYCVARPSSHTGAQVLMALIWNDLFEIRRPDWSSHLIITRDDLIHWLRQQSRFDPLSPGIGLQALICAGIAPKETRKAANGRHWNIETRLDAAIAHWRETKKKAALKPGDHIPDRLLHLAPVFIELFTRFPDMIDTYGPVLEEVFSFYAEIQHPEGYWGLRGEAFATGHIAEQCILAKKAGFAVAVSYEPAVRWMVAHQSETGWFGLAEYRTTGVHCHGLRALGLMLEHADFDPNRD